MKNEDKEKPRKKYINEEEEWQSETYSTNASVVVRGWQQQQVKKKTIT